jgi:hypothetical protein
LLRKKEEERVKKGFFFVRKTRGICVGKSFFLSFLPSRLAHPLPGTKKKIKDFFFRKILMRYLKRRYLLF